MVALATGVVEALASAFLVAEGVCTSTTSLVTLVVVFLLVS